MDYPEKSLVESSSPSKGDKVVYVFAILGLIIIVFCIIMRFVDSWLEYSSYINDNWYNGGFELHAIIVYSMLLSPIALLFSLLGLIGFKKNKYRIAKWLAFIGIIVSLIFILLNIGDMAWLILVD
jgi:heme/copper-type cytochrome/quinol oxidase subunit 1